ncbi:MAG: glutaredoxin family protein [Candidatus Dormibacteraeota bacterium]|nr:glutaredoxin family protein [Candidatus Dormibacteraeota bacterium]
MNSLPPASAGGASKILVYGTSWCAECRIAKRVLQEHGVDYDEVDIEANPDAAREVLRLNNGMRSVPTIIFPDGTVLVEPSRRELTARLQ